MEEVVEGFGEDAGVGQVEGAEVEDDGEEDAEDEAQPREGERSGGVVGGDHHGEGEEEEGGDVLEGVAPAEADEATGTGLPHEEPGDVQEDVVGDHRDEVVAEGVEHDDAAPHEGAVEEADGHINSGTPARDDKVGIQCHHGREGAIEAEQREEEGGRVPFLACQQDDEVLGDEG